MADDRMKKAIGGAPEWVQEFLQRIEDRDEVRDETAKLDRERAHKATMSSLAELAESVGQLGGAVSRVDRKVEGLRIEMRSTRQDVAEHAARIAKLENEVHELHDQISVLNVKAESLEVEIATLRERGGD